MTVKSSANVQPRTTINIRPDVRVKIDKIRHVNRWSIITTIDAALDHYIDTVLDQDEPATP